MNICLDARKHQKGFSVVELLVAVVIGAIILTAMMQFFSAQLTSMRTENARRAAQITARGAMNFIVRQLQHVGRDPNGRTFHNVNDQTLPAAIMGASSTSIHYRANLSTSSTDNDTGDAWEDVTFFYNNGAIWVTQGQSGTFALTDNGNPRNSYVPSQGGLTFSYLDRNSTPTTVLADIRRITVSITVRGIVAQSQSEPVVTLSQDVFLRNVS